MQIDDLKRDLKDGLMLHRLLELASGLKKKNEINHEKRERRRRRNKKERTKKRKQKKETKKRKKKKKGKSCF